MANLTNTLDSPVRVANLLRGAGIDPKPCVLRAALNMDPDRLLEVLHGVIRKREARKKAYAEADQSFRGVV